MLCPWCEKETSEQVCPDCGRQLEGFRDEEPEAFTCLRCDGNMESQGITQIQLGKHSFFFGDLSNLLSGSLPVEIFKCSKCNKLEFYAPQE